MKNRPARELYYKRTLDILLSLVGFFFFFPFFILFSFLIWCEDGRPIFYKQKRIGRNGKEFQILKFRSMCIGSKEIPASDIKNEDSQIKVTKIGKFLRATAMDELPQLINILKGDMSFVGWRPIMPCELHTMDPKIFSIRSSLRPGLTGVAQVYTDKYVSTDEKLRYDLEYIRNQSLWCDIKIIFHSVVITLKRRWEARGKKV